MRIAGRSMLWALLVVCCAFLAESAEAQQQVIYEFEYIERFYADASKTGPIVGAKWRDCCGNWLIYGQYTAYYEGANYPCDDCFPGGGDDWLVASPEPRPTEQMQKIALRRKLSTAHGQPSSCTRSKNAI